MKLKRIIPCLQLDNYKLVKTKKFKNPKYVGDPINVIKIFNDKEVDEIMILDLTASRDERKPNFDLIKQIAGECFMPLSYGGGISSLEDAKRIFDCGCEKIVFQSLFLDKPELISKISSRFGSQSIVISIDLKKNWRGKIYPFSTKNKKTLRNLTLNELIKKAEKFGAGEILIQLMHLEGTRSGAKPELIKNAFEYSSIPIISSGGIGSYDDIKKCFDFGADAVAAGAFFIFNGPYDAVLISYPSQDIIYKLNQ